MRQVVEIQNLLTLIVAAIALVGLQAVAAAAEPDSLGTDFLLRAGKIYTGTGAVFERGSVLVQGGKIVAVGVQVEAPRGTPVYELLGHVVIPGLIDAETSLTGETSDVDRSVSPEIQAVDGWDFFADRRAILQGGVTTVHVGPGVSHSAGKPTRLVSGRGCVVKTAGLAANPLARVLLRATGLQVTLGELPKRPPSIYDPPISASPDNPFDVLPLQLPQSRPGEFLALRTLFDNARQLLKAWGGGAEASFPEPAVFDAAPAALVLNGVDYLRVRANRARDILQMLRVAKEQKLRMVLEGGREADLVARELVDAGVPCVFAGGFQPGVIVGGDLTSETSEGRYREELLVKLVKAGVSVVIHSPTDAETGDLLLQAESAVRAGLDPLAALHCVTSSAARVLGVNDRVGSIEPGKDADLVVLGGDLFTVEGKVQAVFVSGELVHHEGPSGLGPDATIVRSRSVHNGKGDVTPAGIVVIEKKKIRYVGPGPFSAQLSPRAIVVDASNEVIVPGFIDSGTSVGARAEVLVAEAAALSGAAGGGGRSTFRLADAIEPRDPSLMEPLRRGITTVAILPDPSVPIAGQVTVWKLKGGSREEATIRSFAGLVIRTDVQAQELKKAKEYHERWKAYELKPQGDAPEKREELEPFRALLEKKATAFVYASPIESAIVLARTLVTDFGMRVVVHGPGRVDRVAEDLRRLGVQAILSIPFVAAEGPMKVNVPRQVAASGLRFCFRSGVATGAGELVPQIAFAVSQGWDAESALAALTIRAAEILGVEERVGSLEEGKDGDLVFLSGEPFAPGTRVLRVMVEGDLKP